jgi:hypothetical protein
VLSLALTLSPWVSRCGTHDCRRIIGAILVIRDSMIFEMRAVTLLTPRRQFFEDSVGYRGMLRPAHPSEVADL